MKIDWFNEKSVFYIDGYKRSGNTFIQMLIKKVYTDIETVHHFHSVGALKFAIDKGLPSFILYRHPADSITSNYLMEYSWRFNLENYSEINHDHNLLRTFSKSYSHYYTHVLNYLVRVYLISFDELISNPSQQLVFINERIPIKYQIDEKQIINTVPVVSH